MKITVFYDYICPFSYIGSRRIQQIGAEYDIGLEWKGYEIHPEYSPQGKERRRTLRAIRRAESLQSIMEEEIQCPEVREFKPLDSSQCNAFEMFPHAVGRHEPLDQGIVFLTQGDEADIRCVPLVAGSCVTDRTELDFYHAQREST